MNAYGEAFTNEPDTTANWLLFAEYFVVYSYMYVLVVVEVVGTCHNSITSV